MNTRSNDRNLNRARLKKLLTIGLLTTRPDQDCFDAFAEQAVSDRQREERA